MAVTFTTTHHAAMMLVRFQNWKEETKKDSFIEFLQHSDFEADEALYIIKDCERAYRREVFKPPTPPQ